MSTQNQEKKSLGSDRFQSLSRKTGKASSQAVVEQVPPWLKQLLTKYDERGGPLVGLEQGGIGQQEELLGPIPPAPTSTEAGLSALLEQMAEEGLPESSSDQLATSVEWGAYNKSADLSSPSLDDLLANMTVGPDDPYQIASPSYGQPTTFPTTEQETEALDWITDMIPGASVTQSEQNYGRPTSPSQTETPDWLAEALEESPTSTSIPPVSPSPSPSPAPPASQVDNVDIPDWLNEALSNPSTTSVDVPPPTVSDPNVPDWLTTPTSEKSPETSDYTASGKATPSVDIPDWLNNIVPPPDVPEDRSKQARVTPIEVEENEPAIAIPDWLADMALPATDEIEPFAPPTTQTETPDWITEGITDQTETEEKYPEGGPDWFTQEQSVNQTDDDWLADFGVGLADQEGDLPAWLTETETTSPFLTSQEEQQEPKSGVESVSKLKKLKPSPSTTPSAQPPEAAEAIDESLPWLNETSGIEQGEDWRSELLQSVADTPSESAETSDWFLSETSAEEDELLARRLDWFTSSSEVAPPKIELEQQKDTPAEELEVPDWLFDLPEISPIESAPLSSTSMKQTEIEGKQTAPDWLTELPVEDLETPDWLTNLANEEPETPATWPADLPEALTSEEAGLSSTSVTEEEEDISFWLTDLSEIIINEETIAPPISIQPTEVKEDLETPTWLAEFPDVASTEEPLTHPPAQVDTVKVEEEPEMPPWLGDLPETSATEELSTPSSSLPTEEFEEPSWLADLQEVSPSEGISSTLASTAIEKDTEGLSWLGNLSRAPVSEQSFTTSTSSGVEELEIPSWLADLQEEPIRSAPAEVPQVEAELEILPWLADLPEVTGTVETTSTPAAAIDEEQEAPSWLAELPEVTDTVETTSEPVAAIDEEPEVPAWLAELPEVSAAEMDTASSVPATAEVEAETPAWLADLPQPTTVEEEVQPPAWLTSPTDLTTAEEAPSALADTSEIEEELEIPPWLAGLRKESAPEEVSPPATSTEMSAGDEEPEVPAWLAELPEVSAAEMDTASSVPATAEVEAETPAWLADLPQPATAEEEAQPPAWLTSPTDLTTAEEAPSALADTSEIEEELEIPPWLASLRKESAPEEVSTPTTLTEMQAIDEEQEVPPWLSELSEVTGTGETTSEPVAAIDEEQEVPSWLAELPEVTDTVETTSEPVAAIDEEPEVPAWLAELPEVSAAEMDTASSVPATAEVEAETPAWLADLPQPTTVEEEVQPPAWLTSPTDLTTAEEAPSALADTSEIEEELEIPPWLAGLRKESAPEEVSPPATSTEMSAGDEEPEVPAWLAELPEVSAAEMDTASSVPATAEVEAETPAWLADLPEPTTVEEEAQPPAWLTSPTDLTTAEEAPSALADTPEIEEELEIPPWLAGLRKESAPEEAPSALADTPEIEEELEIPPWLAGSSEVTTEETSSTEIETPPWLVDATETSPVEALEDKVTRGEEEAETSEWLADLAQVTEAELPPEPGWLADLEETQVDEVASPEEEAEISSTLLFEQEPADPDWLLDSTEPPETPADLRGSAASPAEISQLDSNSTTVSDDKPSRPVSSSSGLTLPDWLRTLQSPDEGVEAEDHKSVEATGVLAGLTGLLPAEKVVTATSDLEAHASLLGDQAGALRVAARDFYTIATQAPQPLMISAPFTQRDRVMANAVRAALYLLFIILVALPLIPNFQKTVDPATGTKGPWTEPAGALSEVLDNQRRELISTQLGIIDLQQPGSIALVSFDYATATQGEMEPLAEAVIGRLRGQGMRVIAVSLEPEGAVLAQGMLDKIVTERNEKYGADIVNLGYLPGQVAAIRELVSGRTQLFQITDFQNGLTFEAPERAGWQEVKNLEQIDVVVTLADNPATVRWWVEQMAVATQPVGGERYLLAATSAVAEPFLQPYRASDQLDGLISGINGAAAIEAGRQNFGSARQMLDSQSIAHLLIVILIAVGTMVGWMPSGDHLSGSTSGPKSKKVTKMKEAG